MTDPVPDELEAFFEHHAHTGEPTTAELARGRARLIARLAQTSKPRVLPIELRWLAAGLAATVVASLLALAVNDPKAPDEPARVASAPHDAGTSASMAVLLEGETKEQAAVRLVEAAKVDLRARRYLLASRRLEACLKLIPDEPDCLVTLASVLARKGSDEANPREMELARELYLRFLRVAPASHKLRDRVQQIVDAAK